MLNFYQKRTLSNTIRLMTILYMLCICQLAIAQTKNFQGVVKDAKGNTLPGVTILETGTSNGVSTNIDGIFEIKLRPGSTLTVSYIGYITRTIPTNDKTTFLNIILEEDVFQLDDVVVVGYGSMKKGEVTSAITSVKKDDFLAGMVKSPEQLLQGKVAGLQLSNYTGDPVLGLEMTIRGVNSLSGNTSPLIVIDGIPGGSLTAISSEDIESIDVLKDGSAAAIYGTRGTNGVIVITTNRAKATKLSMEYNGSISFETFAKHADMLTANDYRRLTDDPDFPGIQDEGTTTDWVDAISRTAISHNHFLSLKVARAFYYYLLLEAFGNVPIIDRFDVPDGYLPATEPRSKVFEFVESELKNNINNLSEDVLNTYGRFNKWNAKMLLARLYLNAEAWIGTLMYNECENLCNEIIATNKYRLDGDYSLPFSTNNELSNETMFVIPFDETKSGGQIYMWARKTLHYSQMQTFNLQATWLDGGCVGVPTFFDNYIEGDKRLEKTWRMGQQYALDGTPLWTNGWCGDPQMLLSYTKDVTNISGDATMYQGYRFGKYEIKIGATGTPDNDYVIMRYAEVLMMKAECILRTGGSSQEAAELVNEVRRRNFDTTNELTGSELEATTIYNGVPVKYGRFLQELGVEFALEGLRRSQLIRFDNNFTKGTWWEHQPTNDTKRNLMLIPFDQLQRNSNLVQNPK